MSSFQELTPLQTRVMALPETIDGDPLDVFLGGGRGGSKTHCMNLLILRGAEEYGSKFKGLFLRQNHQGLRDAMTMALDIYGSAGTMNMQMGLFRFDNGATCEFNQCEHPQQLSKYLGRSFTHIFADECGEWADSMVLDRLRGNLRSTSRVPVRVVMAANPGGVGHAWLYKRHIQGRDPWQPYVEPQTGATFLTAPSVLTDNPFLNEGYRKQLEAATATDAELRKAWLEGDWHIARGAFFAGVIDEHRNMVEPWPTPGAKPEWWSPAWYDPSLPARTLRRRLEVYGNIGAQSWYFFLCGDHGTASPGAWYIVGVSPNGGSEGPDGRWYSGRSIVLIDEFVSNQRDSLTDGMNLSIADHCHYIRGMCSKWGIPAVGVLDDGSFANRGNELTEADEYRKHGVKLSKAGKGRRAAGFEVMRRLLKDAGQTDVPGLYVSRTCAYWWATVPSLARDPKKLDEPDTRGPDHAADATMYSCLNQNPAGEVSSIRRPW